MTPETENALLQATAGIPAKPSPLTVLLLAPVAALAALADDTPGRPESEEDRRRRRAAADDARLKARTQDGES